MSYQADNQYSQYTYQTQMGIEYYPVYQQPYIYPQQYYNQYYSPYNNIKHNEEKSNKKDKRCYTCKPRGKVKQHVINETTSFIFHHDMHKRPVILVTPKRHVLLINELTNEEHEELFKEIREFTKFWNIDDYQISYNVGNWQKHNHFHVKIKISEKIANRMRRDHFSIIKYEDRYTQNKIDQNTDAR